MSFLLDTNVVSAYLKRPRGLTHRFIQYSGRLYYLLGRFGRALCVGIREVRSGFCIDSD
jgi:hypothetical protein